MSSGPGGQPPTGIYILYIYTLYTISVAICYSLGEPAQLINQGLASSGGFKRQTRITRVEVNFMATFE